VAEIMVLGQTLKRRLMDGIAEMLHEVQKRLSGWDQVTVHDPVLTRSITMNPENIS
jgi:urease gamma subunit